MTERLMKWIGIACILAALASHATAAPQKMQISFTGYNKAETLTNFPALVVFSNGMAGGFSYTNFISTNGYDLRLFDADALTPLNYEIESWSTTAASYVWVQVPTLTSNSYIWAKWGDTTQTNQLATTTNGATWDTSFKGVWHMDETNAMIMDSTRYGHSATGATGLAFITPTNSSIGTPALNFNSLSFTSACFAAIAPSTDFDMTNNWTVSVWANRQAYNQINGTYCAPLGSFADVNLGWVFASRDSTHTVQFFNGPAWSAFVGVTWPSNQWANVTMTKTGTLAYVYVNGVLANTSALSTNLWPSVNSLMIGTAGPGRLTTNQSWKGGLDEIRIAQVQASSNWVWAAYQNAASNSAFLAASTVAPDTAPNSIIPLSLQNGWIIQIQGY